MFLVFFLTGALGLGMFIYIDKYCLLKCAKYFYKKLYMQREFYLSIHAFIVNYNGK